MTKAAALQAFFARFMPAYPETNVPEDATFPYLTYSAAFGAFGDEPAALTVNLWYYTESEAEPNAKADEISRRLGRGGTILPCDGGGIWLRRGAPWCQSVAVAEDARIKRRYINMEAEFLTKE